jgi:hypothetical protein
MAEAMAINPAASPAKGRKPSEPVQTDSSSASQQDVSAAPLGAPTTVAEPGSPPLPARHTAATPGPRATRFQEAYASSLAHTLSRIGWDNFATCYPTVAARAPDTLRHVQKQMVERLGVLCEVRPSALSGGEGGGRGERAGEQTAAEFGAFVTGEPTLARGKQPS